jgi:hypothetical protein
VLQGKELADDQPGGEGGAVLWRLNLDRLNQLLRDAAIQQAATRRLDRSSY